MASELSREAAARLAEIDSLQDEVLRRLDELERRSADVLAACLTAAATQPSSAAATALGLARPAA